MSLKTKSVLRLFLACFLYFSTTLAYAQSGDSIFVPAYPQNDPDIQKSQPSPLNQLITLQRNLYRIVLTFDERARQVESVSRRFESDYLKSQEYRITQQDSDSASNYTLTGYGTLVKEPTMCAELDNALKNYIAKNATDLKAAVTQLVAETQHYTDAQKKETAAVIRTAIHASDTDYRRAQEILYLCLYRYKSMTGVPTRYSVEKTLREWFNIQAPLIDLWLGPVD